MEIWCKDSALSIFLSGTEAYFFDAFGRFYAAWDQGWFVSHGLSGRSVARRWVNARRQIRSLKSDEIRDQQRKSQKILELALQEVTRPLKNFFKDVLAQVLRMALVVV